MVSIKSVLLNLQSLPPVPLRDYRKGYGFLRGILSTGPCNCLQAFRLLCRVSPLTAPGPAQRTTGWNSYNWSSPLALAEGFHKGFGHPSRAAAHDAFLSFEPGHDLDALAGDLELADVFGVIATAQF
jgi:hypothetical protein